MCIRDRPLADGLLGKVIVVTGAGRSMGREIALLCAQEGAAVVVNDVGSSPAGDGVEPVLAEGVVREIVDAGGVAVPNAGDVADPKGARSIVDDALARFGLSLIHI